MKLDWRCRTGGAAGPASPAHRFGGGPGRARRRSGGCRPGARRRVHGVPPDPDRRAWQRGGGRFQRQSPSAGVSVRSTNRRVADPGASIDQSKASHALRNTVSKLVNPRGSIVVPWCAEIAGPKYSIHYRMSGQPCRCDGVRRGRLGQRINEPRNEPHGHRGQGVDARLEAVAIVHRLMRRSIRRTNSALSSIPTHRRRSCAAASRVVPEPAYGSSTTSPGSLVSVTQRWAKLIGIGAG